MHRTVGPSYNPFANELIQAQIERDKYKRGNTVLISALMGMVAQYFRGDEETGYRHSYFSAEEEAIRILVDAGFATQVGNANLYFLLWDKIQARIDDDSCYVPPVSPEEK